MAPLFPQMSPWRRRWQWQNLKHEKAGPLIFLASSPFPPNIKRARLLLAFDPATFSPDVVGPYQPGW